MMLKIRWNELRVETVLKFMSGELIPDGEIVLEDGNVYIYLEEDC